MKPIEIAMKYNLTEAPSADVSESVLNNSFVVSFYYVDYEKNIIPKFYRLLLTPCDKQNFEYKGHFYVRSADPTESGAWLTIGAYCNNNSLDKFFIYCNFIMCKQGSHDWATETMKNISITRITNA